MTTERSVGDVGLLVLRLGVGGTVAAHGAQKLFGWFGGHGLAGTAAFFDQVGFTPGRTNAIAAGLAEGGGGALIALGMATPSAGAAIAGTMAVASTMHTDKGFFATEGGFEYPAMLSLAGAALALTGPGSYSVDGLLGHRLNQGWMKGVALGLVGPAVASVILRRRKAIAAAQKAAATAGGGDPTE